MAERPRMSALRRYQSHLQDGGQGDPHWRSTSATSAASRSRVTVGTIFESSHIPLHLWLQAMLSVASIEEGHFSQSVPPHLGRDPQDRMVHDPSHPRGNARWSLRPDGRQLQHGRGRRDLHRSQEGLAEEDRLDFTQKYRAHPGGARRPRAQLPYRRHPRAIEPIVTRKHRARKPR